MSLERLWAGWRTQYVDGIGDGSDERACVFCNILAGDAPDDEVLVVRREPLTVAVLNAYPYTSGHLMVLPVRHVADLEDVSDDESAAVWALLGDAVRALKRAYRPDGINVGANLGRVAGAGTPGHFHLHCLPRWDGDTNFMTTVANARVLPEALDASWARVREAWPA